MQTTYTLPFPTGQDDTGKLNNFLSTVPDGTSTNTVLIVAPAANLTYKLNTTITKQGFSNPAGLWAPKRHFTTYDFLGATLTAQARVTEGAVFRADECVNCTFKNFHSIGINPNNSLSGETYHGFWVRGGSDLLIDGHVATDIVRGDGFALNPGDITVPLRVTYQNFKIARSSRQGLSSTSADTVTIQNGTIDDVANFNLIDLEPLTRTANSGTYNKNWVIRNVGLGKYKYGLGSVSSINMSGGYNDNITIDGCYALAGTTAPLRFYAKAPSPGSVTGLKVVNCLSSVALNDTYFLWIERAGQTDAVMKNVEVGGNDIKFKVVNGTMGVRIGNNVSACASINLHDNHFRQAKAVYTKSVSGCKPVSTNNSLT